MKKNKFVCILILTLFMFSTICVNAESQLYEFTGRYDWFEEYDAPGAIEDILKIENGYIVSGYLDNSALIHFLDDNKKLVKKVDISIPYDIVKVYSCEDNYCAIGVSLEGMGYVGVTFSSEGEIIDTKVIVTEWWVSKDKTYIKELGNYLYIFDTNVNNQKDGIENDLVVKVNKNDFDNQDWFSFNDLSQNEKKDLSDYFTIIDQYMIDDKGEKLGPLFIHEYKDGYLFGLFDYVNGSNGYVYYYSDGGQVWNKIYEGNHISDAIPYQDGILIWDTPNLSYQSKLIYCDEKGNIISTDIIDQYFNDIDNYEISLSYKMIPIGDNFALTSEYHYEQYGPRPIGPDSGGYSVLFFKPIVKNMETDNKHENGNDKIKNPETGVYDHVIIGMIVVLLFILIYIIIRRFNRFSRLY